jgi:hypothetical protein
MFACAWCHRLVAETAERCSCGQNPRSRPFPWPCPACHEEQVRPATIHFTTETLGCAPPLDIPNLVVPQCGACGYLVFDFQANEQFRAAARDAQQRFWTRSRDASAQ